MRNFIIVGHRAMTTPQFTLNDLSGTGGRMDILARAVNSAFFLSHDIRRDVEVTIVLQGPEDPPKTIRFLGSELKYLNPSERSTGGLIRNAIIKHTVGKTESNNINSDAEKLKTDGLPNEQNTSPGIFISANGFPEVLKFYSTKSTLIHLHESSPDISKTDLDGELTFIFSDDMNFTAEEEELIKEHTSHEFSLGPLVYHTDHCLSVVHNFLDRRMED